MTPQKSTPPEGEPQSPPSSLPDPDEVWGDKMLEALERAVAKLNDNEPKNGKPGAPGGS